MATRRALAWMSLAQGSFFVLQFAGSVILARLLTPYEMGVYAIAMALVGVLAIVQATGLQSFVVREPDISGDTLATAFTINAAIGLVLAAAIAGVSLVGGELLREPGVRQVLLLLSVLPLLGILEFLPAARMEREGRFPVIATVGMARHMTATVVTVALAFAGYSYLSLAYGVIAGAVVSLIAFNLVGRRFVSFRVRLAEWRGVLRHGSHMLAISGVNSLAARASELALGQLAGLGALGLYTRATTINNLLWENIHMVIGRVLLVDFAERKRQGQSLRDAYLRVVEMLAALLWPAFGGLAVLAGPFIQIVYGERWTAAAMPLSMLAIAAMVLVSITQTWEVFVASRETGRQARLEFVRTGFGLVLFVGGALVSLTAAAAARIGEALFSLILYRPHLDRMTDTHTRDFIGIYGRSAALTLAAVGPALGLMIFNGWSPATPPLSVAVAVIVGVAAWAATLVALRHPLCAEFSRLLAKLNPG